MESSKILRNGSTPLDNDLSPPKCFIRYDVNHFMKLLSSLPSLKGAKVRPTRQFYLCCHSQLIQSDNLDDARSLMKNIFLVSLCDFQGISLVSGHKTKCQRAKEYLRNRIQTGMVVSDDLVDYDDGSDDLRKMMHSKFLEDDPSLIPGEEPLSFHSWALAIKDEAMQNLEEGDEGNQQWCPNLVDMIELMIDFPLWSAIMTRYYGYGNLTASSSPVESNFRIIKSLFETPSIASENGRIF